MSAKGNDEWLHGIGLAEREGSGVGAVDLDAPGEQLTPASHGTDADALARARTSGSANEDSDNDEGRSGPGHQDPEAAPDQPAEDPGGDGGQEQRTRRFNPWVAGMFGGAVAVATLVTAVGTTVLGTPARPAPSAPPKTSLAAHPTAAPTSGSVAPAEAADAPLPYIASADCPAGSTPAQSLADPDKPTPWICQRHTDGQPLSITLGPSGMERSYVITAVSIIPGDIAPAQGSATEPWLQHRVVTRLQWQFNDTANTVLTQATGNVRGEAVLPVPRLNASRITVIIQETSRPPATVVSAAPTAPGPFGDILAPPAGGYPATPPIPGGDPQQPDPADTTFAVSGIKIIGHRAL